MTKEEEKEHEKKQEIANARFDSPLGRAALERTLTRLDDEVRKNGQSGLLAETGTRWAYLALLEVNENIDVRSKMSTQQLAHEYILAKIKSKKYLRDVIVSKERKNIATTISVFDPQKRTYFPRFERLQDLVLHLAKGDNRISSIINRYNLLDPICENLVFSWPATPRQWDTLCFSKWGIRIENRKFLLLRH